ncbi:MAG: OsmC family protein [Leptospiraceae bacterium]|nr:OsmC family protein [Leptospiraceae bacterium]
MSDVHYYDVDIQWTETRKGLMESEGLQSLEVATPPQFPKGIPGIWSPEHLYVAAASSCLMTTFLAVAENSKLEFISYSCKAKAKLEKVEGKFLITEIDLSPTIVIKNSEEVEKAEKLIHKSEAACLISNSMKTKVSLKDIEIKVG